MSFLNNPDIQDDGQGNVNIQKPDGNAANLNITGATTGTWFNFNNMQNNGNTTVVFQNKDGKTPVDVTVTGGATVSKNLMVSGTSSLNGKTNINSQADSLPFQVSGAGGQFWFYSSGGQNNGAIIRAIQNQFGLIFTGNDRVRVEGAAGDNRAATLQDVANVNVSGRFTSSTIYNAGNLFGVQFVTNSIAGFVFQCFVGFTGGGACTWTYPRSLGNSGFVCPIGSPGNLSGLNMSSGGQVSFNAPSNSQILIVAAGSG